MEQSVVFWFLLSKFLALSISSFFVFEMMGGFVWVWGAKSYRHIIARKLGLILSMTMKRIRRNKKWRILNPRLYLTILSRSLLKESRSVYFAWNVRYSFERTRAIAWIEITVCRKPFTYCTFWMYLIVLLLITINETRYIVS